MKTNWGLVYLLRSDWISNGKLQRRFSLGFLGWRKTAIPLTEAIGSVPGSLSGRTSPGPTAMEIRDLIRRIGVYYPLRNFSAAGVAL